MALSLITKVSTNLVAGATDSGSDANIDAADEVAWVISGAAQTIDITFDATNLFVQELNYTARYTGHKDDFLIIQAYDPVNIEWDTISNSATQINSGLSYVDQHISIGQEYVAGNGEVIIRVTGSGLRQTPLTYLDYFSLLTATTNDYVLTASEVADAVVQRMPSAVYFGTVYLDTEEGTDGLDYGVSGTAQYPVKTLANAMQIADVIHSRKITVMGGSAVVLDRAIDGYALKSSGTGLATGYSVDFAGFSIAASTIEGALISGTYLATTRPTLQGCRIEDITGPPLFMESCMLSGTFTVNAGGLVLMLDCITTADQAKARTIKFAAAGIVIDSYDMTAGFLVAGMQADSMFVLTGEGVVEFDATNLGGSAFIMGSYQITDNTSGAVAFVTNNNFDRAENVSENWDRQNASHVIPGSTGWHQFNALMNTDARLDNLDATISSRATQQSVDDKVDAPSSNLDDYKADVSALATSAELTPIATDVGSTLQIVDTDGVAISPATQAEIAAVLLKYGAVNAEGDAEAYSLVDLILTGLNSKLVEGIDGAGTQTVYKTDGDVFRTGPVKLDEQAKPMIGVGDGAA